ncbi:MAG: acyl-CoA dehydrogenase family protein, partial [Pigmentiphaga sp.]
MYSPPLNDIRFVLSELAGLEAVCALPGYEEVSPDLVEAVLTENARLMREVIAPLNRTGDSTPARWKEGAVVTPPGFREAFRQFVAGGWQGVPHPPAMGGQGLPHLVAAACVENVNSASLAFALVTLLSDGVVDALLTAGSPEQQQRYIPPLLDGRMTGTMNLTEPQAGSDLAQIHTRAEPRADGSYRIFGQKIFITYGEHDLADNILHLVLARTPDAPPGIKGISLFIVPKFLPHDDGDTSQRSEDASWQRDDGGKGSRNDVYCASIEHKLGIHGSPTAVMVYGDDKGEVGAGAIGYRVGEENHGLQYMFVMMNAARYAVGLQGVAIAERACQQALAYARERVQSRAIGSANAADTIDQHPDVQRMLLTMRALTESSRALAYVAAA